MANNFLSVPVVTMMPEARINSRRFRRMEKKCGCKLDRSARKEISRLVNKYLSNRHMQIVWPKANTKMKNSLRRIAKQSYALAREINGDGVTELINRISKTEGPQVAAIKTKGFIEAHDAIQHMLADNLGIDIDKLDACVTTLFHISGAARGAISDLPSGKSGPVKDTKIVPFLEELHGLFKKAGGEGIYWKDPAVLRNPFTGKYFDFVAILLKALPKEYQRKNRALGEFFEEAVFQ
jgi:hypothetical protein